MPFTIGQTITASNYNTLRTNVLGVYQTLYGQSPYSSTVTGNSTPNAGDGDQITTTEMLNLFLDVQAAYLHQTGSVNSNIAVPEVGLTVSADESEAGGHSGMILAVGLTNPATITTDTNHNLKDGVLITFNDVEGTTELNGLSYYVKVTGSADIELYTNSALTTGLNATGYTTFSGYGHWNAQATAVTDGTKMGYNDYETAILDVVNFNGEVSGWPLLTNFTLGTPTASATRTASWGGTGTGGSGPPNSIYHVVTVTFTSAAALGYYFNAGGQIRFNASASGGSDPKDTEWIGMLSAMGTISFDKYDTSASSGTSAGLGADDLTASYQTLLTKSGSGAYANNEYTLEGLKSAGNVLRFRISMNDDYTGTFFDYDITADFDSSCTSFRPDSSFTYNSTTYTAVDLPHPTISNATELTADLASPPS